MNIIRALRQLFQPARLDVPAVPTQVQPVSINQVFQQHLLTAIQNTISVVQPGLEQGQIVLEPAGILLQTNVFELTHHPNAVVGGFGVRLSHPLYFPDGIVECLAGIAESDELAAAAAARIYTDGVLQTVITALEGRHDALLDVFSPIDGAIWHPIVGLLQVQGIWIPRSEELLPEYFFQQLKPLLLKQLGRQSFHWLKIYASRMPDGEFIGECNLDNKPWEAGLDVLRSEITTWPEKGEFAGQKQFLLLRRCGLCTPGLSEVAADI